jgi:RNA polymerase sigma factor (sigma-70 family)
MAEFYGITVINDNSASEQSDAIGIGITAIVRIKHAALYEAAKVMGGASALARHLGITSTIMGEWINLKSCPPKDASSGKMKSWTDERIAVMEAKLHELTGKTWDELWPDELRENHAFLKAPKEIEKVYNWKQAAMLSYANATRSRLIEHATPDADSLKSEEFESQKAAVEASLHLLTFRQRKILSMRFGFAGKIHSLNEVGQDLKLTQERVRQIESDALKKLRYFAGLSLIKSSVGVAENAAEEQSA